METRLKKSFLGSMGRELKKSMSNTLWDTNGVLNFRLDEVTWACFGLYALLFHKEFRFEQMVEDRELLEI